LKKYRHIGGDFDRAEFCIIKIAQMGKGYIMVSQKNEKEE